MKLWYSVREKQYSVHYPNAKTHGSRCVRRQALELCALSDVEHRPQRQPPDPAKAQTRLRQLPAHAANVQSANANIAKQRIKGPRRIRSLFGSRTQSPPETSRTCHQDHPPPPTSSKLPHCLTSLLENPAHTLSSPVGTTQFCTRTSQ